MNVGGAWNGFFELLNDGLLARAEGMVPGSDFDAETYKTIKANVWYTNKVTITIPISSYSLIISGKLYLKQQNQFRKKKKKTISSIQSHLEQLKNKKLQSFKIH